MGCQPAQPALDGRFALSAAAATAGQPSAGVGAAPLQSATARRARRTRRLGRAGRLTGGFWARGIGWRERRLCQGNPRRLERHVNGRHFWPGIPQRGPCVPIGFGRAGLLTEVGRRRLGFGRIGQKVQPRTTGLHGIGD